MADDDAERNDIASPRSRPDDAAVREWLRRELQGRYGGTVSMPLPERLLALLPQG
jgi:hypothetical protein